MTGCTATLATATVETCPPISPGQGDHTDGAFVLDADGRVTHHVTLTTLTCKRHDPDHITEDTGHWCKTGDGENSYTEWRDSTPGATPHADPRCAACGQPGHRFGRNEGPDRFDPQACINVLRGRLGEVSDDEFQAACDAYVATERRSDDADAWILAALVAAAEARTR